MRKVSVIIITLNEEHNIRGILNSVAWADEIIVVDSFSTDNTISIAKEYTDKVLEHAFKSFADQRNWAIPQAAHEWVLLLDADERITPELKEEIQEVLRQKTISEDAFWIGRQSFFMEKKIRYSGWQGDGIVRLIRRDKCRYNDKKVHEEIITEGIRVGRLKNKMHHFTYKNLDHFLDKMRRYSKWSAQDHLNKTPRVGYFHLLLKPFFRFLKHYIFQLGFLDGKTGFIISVIMAWGVFLRYVKVKELRTHLRH
ncbi:MAG: glycosyltransferase family 2 protein [Bacteroidetes bacterium]|nr:glycosyltransferase family 2 protein [Bacteroidota bacterium]